METIYRVKFKCYQYNTGAADNGTYTHHVDFDTIKKANELANKIDTAYEHKDDYESWAYKWGQLFMDKHLILPGYINSDASIFKIEERRIR